MFDVQDHEGCCGDPADAPGAEADVAQRLESRLEQRIAALTDGADRVVGSVELQLHVGADSVRRFLERDGDRSGLAFVAQIAEHPQMVVGPGGRQGEDLAVFAQGGGVVFAAGSYR